MQDSIKYSILDGKNVKNVKYDEIKIFLFGMIIVAGAILLISNLYSVFFNIEFSTIFPRAAILLLSYFIIGSILKFADDSFDEKRFSKKLAVLFIILGFILAVWLSYYDKTTSIIFASLVLATTLTGKTKEKAFFVGSIAYIGTLIGLKILNELSIVFVVIFGALFIDEIMAEWAKKVLRNPALFNYNNSFIYFFRDRNIGILALLILSLTGGIPIINWIAWIFLDFGYIIIEGISRKETIETILLRKVFISDSKNVPKVPSNIKINITTEQKTEESKSIPLSIIPIMSLSKIPNVSMIPGPNLSKIPGTDISMEHDPISNVEISKTEIMSDMPTDVPNMPKTDATKIAQVTELKTEPVTTAVSAK